MTYFSYTATETSLVERFFATVSDFFAAAAKRQAMRRSYAVTYNELSRLTNRELADLGIARSEIRRISMEAAGLV